jgi:hypothetical protein
MPTGEDELICRELRRDRRRQSRRHDAVPDRGFSTPSSWHPGHRGYTTEHPDSAHCRFSRSHPELGAARVKFHPSGLPAFPCLPMPSHAFPCLPMPSHAFPCLPHTQSGIPIVYEATPTPWSFSPRACRTGMADRHSRASGEKFNFGLYTQL